MRCCPSFAKTQRCVKLQEDKSKVLEVYAPVVGASPTSSSLDTNCCCTSGEMADLEAGAKASKEVELPNSAPEGDASSQDDSTRHGGKHKTYDLSIHSLTYKVRVENAASFY